MRKDIRTRLKNEQKNRLLLLVIVNTSQVLHMTRSLKMNEKKG